MNWFTLILLCVMTYLLLCLVIALTISLLFLLIKKESINKSFLSFFLTIFANMASFGFIK